MKWRKGKECRMARIWERGEGKGYCVGEVEKFINLRKLFIPKNKLT